MEEEQGGLESFLKWAAEIGITDSRHSNCSPSCLGHSITVSHFPLAGGRGLAAARDLRKGELILRVPKSALMTTKSILKDQNLCPFLHRHSFLSAAQMLTVCLLYEIGKGKSSWWYPYLVHLPRSYDILANFDEFQRQALQVEEAIWVAEKALLKAESEWKDACKLMKELKLKPKLLSFTAWLWASATISSRTLHIPWDEAGCLCPVGDLFNYAAPGEESNGFDNVESCMDTSSLEVSSLPNGETFDNMVPNQFEACFQRLTDGGFEEDLAAYCFYARRNYRKGEQVLLSYGTYTNLELLEHYGFVLNKNPNDKAFIPLEPGVYSSISWPRESLYIHQNGKPSFVLLSALRLWAAPVNQRKSVGYLVYSGAQISVHNEISVMKYILEKCVVVLKDLPTSVEEDSLLLSRIDVILDCTNHIENAKLDVSGGELHAFLEANDLQNRKDNVKVVLSRKARMSLNKWKLAVQWRLRYKNILSDCISYCTEVINSLSCKSVMTT